MGRRRRSSRRFWAAAQRMSERNASATPSGRPYDRNTPWQAQQAAAVLRTLLSRPRRGSLRMVRWLFFVLVAISIGIVLGAVAIDLTNG